MGGLYASIWRHAAGARRQLLISWLLLVAAAVLELVAPWLAARAIDTLQKNGAGALTHAAGYVGAILAVSGLAWALHGPGRIGERTVALRIRQRFSDALYAKLMRLPMSWHDRHHSGEVQQRIGQSTSALYNFAQSQFTYLKSAVYFIGAAAALILYSPWIGLLALAGYIGVAFLMVRFDGPLMRLAQEENTAERRFQAKMLDFLGNVSTVFSLRMQQSSRQLVNERMDDVFVPLKKSIVLVEAKWCAADLASVMLTWGLVAAAAWPRHGGTVLLGSVFLVHQYAQQARGVVLSAADKFQSFARTRTDVASADPILSAEDMPAAGEALHADWQRLSIKGLCYEHPAPDAGADAQAPAGLHHVSLQCERGDRIALIGHSGSGKSTLMRVLAGHYMPTQGRFETDARAYPHTRHLGSIATLIPQEGDVFEATVRENISLSGAHSDEEIARVIHASAFDTVMRDGAMGLSTPITERGFNLSGGQRQRLCLARGLLAASASSLIMLDEPTSALDPVTEDTVLSRISAAFPEACVMASVHRMSLLHHFNKVVMMANGRVQDAGTVEELLARQPAFREMLNMASEELA
ncbi:ABC transporter ATP-binding protein [Noviherbaspirillum sp. DKR-6]|uniref:ABC transporter ATP-binding protein n=2 Tax=Noviherbaspirillum pedocola TaxID=2801341 RepID=A0A934W4S2_9BURK|nr:ABC transporter ATP-binding protein [Noviherbaspirillum pedocola]